MKFSIYWNYATRSLLRGGQRTVLAIFCIAVGVMAIVALQLVGDSVNQSLTGNVREANGGDISVTSRGLPIQPKDLTTFDGLKSKGEITDYATVNSEGSSYTLDNGDGVTFNFLGISPNYPLVGDAQFISPSTNLHMRDVVKGNDVAVNKDLLDALHAHLGDTLQAPVTNDGRLVSFTIKAVYQNGGGFSGDRVIIAEATLDAIQLASGKSVPPTYSAVYITAPDAQVNAAKNDITNALPGKSVTTVADQLKQQQANVSNLRLFLQVVGLLALFIGGIGIINTMQVLLRRRRVEIAMLKTAGYREGDLYTLFGLEAALLGLVGGALGTLAGVGVSALVRQIVGNTLRIELPVVLDSGTILSGLFIGFSTALIFGLLPIVQASQVRPLSVLRDSTEDQKAGSWLITGGLLVLLSVLFVGLATTILGNITTAILIVYGGVGVVAALALGFGLLVWSISRLPVYEVPSARILRWIGLAFLIVIGGGLAFALLGLIGAAAVGIASALGNSGLGIYFTTVLGGLGLVIFGGSLVYFLATLVDVAVMFLPRGAKTAVMLAFRNMGRQRIRTTTTLTALFIGVFAIGLVVILGQGIKDAINNVISTALSRNVYIGVAPSQADQVKAQIAGKSYIDQSKTQQNLIAGAIPVTVAGQDVNAILTAAKQSGRSALGADEIGGELGSIQGYDLSNSSTTFDLLPKDGGRELGPADAGTNNVLVNSRLTLAPVNLKLNDTIVVTGYDFNTPVTRTLTVVGFLDNNSTKNVTIGSIITDNSVATVIGGSQLQELFGLKVQPDKVSTLRSELKKTLPQATVLDLGQITALINNIFNNIIVLLSTISSLALIAGLIIIANAVALAMLERRREIGILKSVGHTSQSVLATVLLENGLVGLLGALVAMLLVSAAITLISSLAKTSIGLGLPLVALIIGSTVIVTMAISALVAWSATRVRPIEVLRYE